MIAACLLQGLAVLCAVAGVYAWLLHGGADAATARAMAFVTLVAGNLAVIVANRRARAAEPTRLLARNVPLLWVTGGALAALVATIYVPPVALLFGFASLAPQAFVAGLAAGPASVVAFEAIRSVLSVGRRHK
jgi:Ca2+-transporting ATPase